MSFKFNKITKIKSIKAKSMKEALQKFFRSDFYKIGIIIIVVFNSIILGLDTYKNFEPFVYEVLNFIDTICLVIFILESILKLYAFGLSFFTSHEKGWNIFDLAIVLISVFANSEYAVLRAFRIFRILRLLSVIPSMRFICSMMVLALPQIVSIVLLLLIFYYVYGVLCCNLFGKDFPAYFGSLQDSLFTLFCMMALDGGSGVIKDVMSKYPYAWLVFISFILICTFVIMNLIIAIIMNSVDEIKRKNEERDKKGL